MSFDFVPVDNQRIADIAGCRFDEEKVIPGPVIYGRTHVLSKKLGEVKNCGPCVLLTSFSDASLTDSMVAQAPPNVRMWFSNNVVAASPRAFNIPIGFRFNRESQKECLQQADGPRPSRRNLLYINFMRAILRDPNPRAGLYEKFEGFDWATVRGGTRETSISIDEFYQDIRYHDYVLSPPGAGLDCHRHWESIALGSIPIVLRSPATDVLEDMPCLRVDNWEEVTKERMENELPCLRDRFSWDSMRKLDMRYWRTIIEDAIDCLRNS